MDAMGPEYLAVQDVVELGSASSLAGPPGVDGDVDEGDDTYENTQI